MQERIFDISNLVSEPIWVGLYFGLVILFMIGLGLAGVGVALFWFGKYIKNYKIEIAYKMSVFFILIFIYIGVAVGIYFIFSNVQQGINVEVLEQIRIDVKQEFNIDLPTNYNDWIRFDDSVFPNWFKNDYWPDIVDALVKYPIG